MIISASRRTDIPAFYLDWFMGRLRAGHCLVRNPFAPSQSSRVSLARPDVDCIVFWTRHPQALARRVGELSDLGHETFCLATVTGAPRGMEPRRPSLECAVRGLHALAREWGPGRIVWRYDPVMLTEATPPAWHLKTFAALAARIEGAACRSKTSLFEGYRKTRGRMRALERQGYGLLAPPDDEVREMFAGMVEIAARHGMELQACAQGTALADCGVPAGACIDAAWLGQELGAPVHGGKDAHQRSDCLCAPSRDVGAYDTCLFGCAYCYATSNPARARQQHAQHDPGGEALLPVREERGGTPRQEQGRLPL